MELWTNQQMNFQRNSHFPASRETLAMRPDMGKPRLESVTAAKEWTIANRTLEDWAYRIEQCAHEAEDAHLLPLNSDLLDLRDEIVHLLHQNV